MAGLWLGRLLRGVRAGDAHLVSTHVARLGPVMPLQLRSEAFSNGSSIPLRHAGRGLGDNVAPPLEWSPAPLGTLELVLVMQDPDVPLFRPIVHLLATGLAPTRTSLPEGALNGPSAVGEVKLGKGAFGRVGYAGPRPLPGHGSHRYIFQLTALRRPLTVRATGCVTYKDLVAALTADNVLAFGQLVGTHTR